MPIMLEDVNGDNRVYHCVVLISNVKYCVRLPERKRMFFTMSCGILISKGF